MAFLAITTGESVFQLLTVLFCFFVILGLTYITTKWIAGYQKVQSFQKNIQVVETMKITTNKYIQIIKVGMDTYYVIGIGKDEISPLGQLTGDQLKDLPVTPSGDMAHPGGFEDILNKLKGNLPKK